MKSELIVDVTPQEIAIALTENDRLMEVNREKRGVDTFAVGNIYYGRVKKIMPALNAAFVDVGHEKEAFLHYLDLGTEFLTQQKYITKLVSDRRRIPEIHKIEHQPACGKEGQIADYLKVGDTILVQVTKEPINSGEKGSIDITYNGKGLVPGRFSKTVTVRSNAKNRIVRLIIEGEMTE
jgi:ribonuclease G